MSINANNDALNEILSIINNLPSADGSSGGMVYTNIVYNDDNTVTLTDKDGVDHIMVCEYTDGVLTALTYDGKSVELTYEEDTLINIGAIEVDMANVPIESGGGEDDFIGIKFSNYSNDYMNIPKTADARSLGKQEIKSTRVLQGAFSNSSINPNGGYFAYLEEVYLPEDLKTLYSTFVNCTKLKNIYGSLSSVFEIDTAFKNCTSLDINSVLARMTALRTIGYQSFYGCTQVAEITLPATVNSIHKEAFYGCTNLTKINCLFAEGSVTGQPWGATNADVVYVTGV